ncbi:MAG: phosphorylase [Lachnospiraceae bacterium]|nr:phosphorylase [Lachnospiraceae bacterium]
MIIKNEFPILEYSTEKTAIINPGSDSVKAPRLCLVTFFEEVLNDVVKKYNGTIIATYRSEMRTFHVYQFTYKGIEVCAVQALVSSGAIAMMTDFLYGLGVEAIVCCGSCGVLDDIPAGDIIIPTRALRDEGASYKYLPPSRFVEVSPIAIAAFKQALDAHKIAYVECATWSTGGFFRETKEMVAYRREEGCKVVEMECATMAAVAEFRGKIFGQLLYSGDILVGSEQYDDRGWYNNLSAREKLFYVSLEALCLL